MLQLSNKDGVQICKAPRSSNQMLEIIKSKYATNQKIAENKNIHLRVTYIAKIK